MPVGIVSAFHSIDLLERSYTDTFCNYEPTLFMPPCSRGSMWHALSLSCHPVQLRCSANIACTRDCRGDKKSSTVVPLWSHSHSQCSIPVPDPRAQKRPLSAAPAAAQFWSRSICCPATSFADCSSGTQWCKCICGCQIEYWGSRGLFSSPLETQVRGKQFSGWSASESLNDLGAGEVYKDTKCTSKLNIGMKC